MATDQGGGRKPVAFLHRLGHGFAGLLLPRKCVTCGLRGALMCERCLRTARRISPPICHKCGRPATDRSVGFPMRYPLICRACKDSSGSLDYLRSAYLFSGIIKDAVHHFKYRGISSLAPVLGELLADYLVSNPIPADIIVPVPLHRQRWKERGYDQAELLADSLGRKSRLPVGKRWLVRTRPTPPQVGTAGAAERRTNVRGAFAAGPGIRPDASVLLIDDVCTTGATIEAAAYALRQAGVRTVYGLTLAREA